MADDIVRLSRQFGVRETRGCNELVVEIDQLPLGVGLRDNQGLIIDRILDIRDGKIGAHRVSSGLCPCPSSQRDFASFQATFFRVPLRVNDSTCDFG